MDQPTQPKKTPRRYYTVDDVTSLVIYYKDQKAMDSTFPDAELSSVMTAWITLSPALKAGILAIVNAAGK